MGVGPGAYSEAEEPAFAYADLTLLQLEDEIEALGAVEEDMQLLE